MLKKEWTGRELARACVSIICVIGTFGIALKFITTIIQCNLMGVQNYVYFPIFPNICDSIFLMFSVLWLAYSSTSPYKKRTPH